jgi:hypothetical protein
MKINWDVCKFPFSVDRITIPGVTNSYAQGPQAVKLKDRIRIYFSTRDTDMPGYFRSQVRYVDLDYGLKTVLGKSDTNVISLGELGSYCEHGIFPFNVIQTNQRFIGYVSGWSRRASVSVDTSIGIAFGDFSGQKFTHGGKGPVLSACIDEPFLICDANVATFQEKYHMWYVFGVDWQMNESKIPERTYRIGYANSEDGVSWSRPNPGEQIIPVLSGNEAQAMPTVIQIEENFFVMCFCYRDTFNFRSGGLRGYRLGGAVSTDLRIWRRVDSLFEMPAADWASNMQCYPNLLSLGSRVVLFFNGNGFGKYGFGFATTSMKELANVARLQ